MAYGVHRKGAFKGPRKPNYMTHIAPAAKFHRNLHGGPAAMDSWTTTRVQIC